MSWESCNFTRQLSNYSSMSQGSLLWLNRCFFFFQECYSPFVNGSFFEHEGKPLCEAHYHQSRGSMCQACQQPILGRCVTAMGAKFHPHHLVCHFCLKPLSKGCFKEQENKPYCHPCFIKLFGWGHSRALLPSSGSPREEALWLWVLNLFGFLLWERGWSWSLSWF